MSARHDGVVEHKKSPGTPSRPLRAVPRVGDVLASRRTARADAIAIGLISAASLITVRRYADAIETVQELARRLEVDGWYTADHTRYARVASHRL
jgi:hypothetical protein